MLLFLFLGLLFVYIFIFILLIPYFSVFPSHNSTTFYSPHFPLVLQGIYQWPVLNLDLVFSSLPRCVSCNTIRSSKYGHLGVAYVSAMDKINWHRNKLTGCLKECECCYDTETGVLVSSQMKEIS